MYWMKIQSRQENTVYLALWGMLFAAPVLSLYVRSVSMPDFTFQWSDILMVWKLFVVYFLLFLVHNFVLAPMLIHRQKRVLYFSIVAVILSLFIIYQCSQNATGHLNSRKDSTSHRYSLVSTTWWPSSYWC